MSASANPAVFHVVNAPDGGPAHDTVAALAELPGYFSASEALSAFASTA